MFGSSRRPYPSGLLFSPYSLSKMPTHKLLFCVILWYSAFGLAASLTSSSYCHKDDGNCEEEDEELNLEHITEFLRHEDVADTPVSVISIAGALKGGKSTFLSLMAMYLEANQSPDWYSDGDKEIVESFPIGHGSPDRMTTGIDIYHKPIFVTDQNNEKVALLLLDTQGSFDKDGLDKFSEIFAISSLLSSVQIYNIKGGINENHLNPLQVFVSFSAKFKATTEEKPFQKLLFLFQNMPAYTDYPYGKMGGKEYCDEKVLRYSENDPKEVQAVRKALTRSFESIECILFPSPGNVVAGQEPLKRGEKLKLSHFSPKFMRTITEVFQLLLDPIITKMERGKEQTGEELANLVEEYQKTIKENKIARPGSLMKANYKGNAMNVVERLEVEYLGEIEKIFETADNEDLFAEEHEKLKKELLKKYNFHLGETSFKSLFDKYKLELDLKIAKLYQKALEDFKLKQKKRDELYLEKVRESYNDLMDSKFVGKTLDVLKDAHEWAVKNIRRLTEIPPRLETEADKILNNEYIKRIETLENNKSYFKRFADYVDSFI